MKKQSVMLLMLAFLCSSLSLVGQDFKESDILGYWLNEEKDGKIEIYKEGDKYFGKLIWLLNPIDEETGQPKLDKHNPDDALKTRPTKGIVLLTDFEYEGDGLYEEGEIYDPKSGKTYSCYMKLESMDNLKIKGFIGFSWIGRTTYWTRSE
jgi:uncharacterized protein (DUF2147 family)